MFAAMTGEFESPDSEVPIFQQKRLVLREYDPVTWTPIRRKRTEAVRGSPATSLDFTPNIDFSALPPRTPVCIP